jgi:predicted phage terminase large subunit-like protein
MAKVIASLSEKQADELLADWRFWARPQQIAPDGDWRVWLIMAGRGWGKTRTGAEYVREQIESRTCSRFALVGPTAADCRDVMVEGESGILAISHDGFRPNYEPSKRRLTWPNGTIATTYSADEPDRLRGPQHDGAWCDEPAAWKYPEAFDMLMFGLRLGSDPRAVVTGTPKPVRLIRELLKSPTTHLTRGSTYENRDNLAPAFLEQIVNRYEGTRLGRQELLGELLDDVPGALWTRQRIDDLRVSTAPDLIRIVVAIDPAMTANEDSDETGIGVAGKGVDGHLYVLKDLSCRMSPDGWARRAVNAYQEFQADRIVAEVNNGGDLVEQVLRTVDAKVAYKAVHASRGKRVRAEPISSLYEQGKAHHVGSMPDLEDQMCNFTSDGFDGSPDRVDWLVWAASELMLGNQVQMPPTAQIKSLEQSSTWSLD